ncbi:MAG: mucoidy inhibitor MuiA family protein [Chitinophagales bacterium]
MAIKTTSAMRLMLTLCLATLCFIGSAQTKQTVNSKIEKVIVYTNGAQINRSANTTIDNGKTELIFKDISPNIDKQSIQVKGEGQFTILSVNHQMNYLKIQTVSDEIAQLQKQQDELNEQITYQNAILNVYKQEQLLMEKNQSIGGSNVGVNTENLKAAADFQRARLTEIYTKQIELNKKIKELNDQYQKNAQQLTALNARKETPTSEIHVMVSSKASTSGKFDISYYVKDAGWFANYDLRVEDVNSPVEIYYKANVYQSSGEDWKDVKVTLSNGNPNESGVAPLLYPWRLYYGYAQYEKGKKSNYTNTTITQVSGKITDKYGEGLPGATIIVKGSTVGTITDMDGNYSLQLPFGSNYIVISYIGYNQQELAITSGYLSAVLQESTLSLESVVIKDKNTLGFFGGDAAAISNYSKIDLKTIALETNFEYKHTTFTYDIVEPYTILNDGKIYTIDVQALKVKAIYEYYAAPKIDRDAFLNAMITEWQDLNLLSGEANLFFEGAYLGKTILDVANAKDTLSISLGRDKGVIIQRNKLKEFTQRQFIGTNKKETIAYEIAIRNNKQQSIHIIIKDQFPIATENDMEVEQIENSGGKVDADTGIITWDLNIGAKEEKKLQLKYSVKYPKDKVLEVE